MKPETFFDNFEMLAEAPNGVKKLREMILQLAVRGKLVAQDERDEPASILLGKIKAEKECSFKEKKIRNKEALTYIEVNDLSNDLPKGWTSIRLGKCIDLISGQHLGQDEQNDRGEGLPYLTGPADFGKINPVATRWTSDPKVISEKNDILITVKGAGVGKANMLGLEKAAIGRQLMAIRPIFLDNKYIYLLINASFDKFQASSIGSTVPGIGREDILQFVIGLPPLAEQHCIVSKVDQLMSLCDELEARQHKKREIRAHINSAALDRLLAARAPGEFAQGWRRISDNFDLLYDAPENVGALRQAILQLAVMGKLVAQDEGDEQVTVLMAKINAERERLINENRIKKSVAFPPINLNEIPFIIPKSWAWVKLSDICPVITDGEHLTPEYSDSGVPLLSAKNIGQKYLDFSDVNYVTEKDARSFWSRCKPEKGDILVVSRGGGVGRTIISNHDDFCLMGSVLLFKVSEHYLNKFLYYFLRSTIGNERLKTTSRATAQPAIYILHLKRNYLVPLCPLDEQYRIDSKVDQLMSLCDELEAGLRRSQADSEKLMEAVVGRMLAGE